MRAKRPRANGNRGENDPGWNDPGGGGGQTGSGAKRPGTYTVTGWQGFVDIHMSSGMSIDFEVAGENWKVAGKLMWMASSVPFTARGLGPPEALG
jgi:hypothetical protein